MTVIPLSNTKLMPMEESIIEEVATASRACWDSASSNREWTAAIMKALVDLGKRSGFATGCTHREAAGSDHGEWLVDLFWFKRQYARDWGKGLALACEIEWNPGTEYVMEDFQKLTVMLSDWRLMVFDHLHMDHTRSLIDQCMELCPEGMGFRYLLVGVSSQSQREVVYEAFQR